jgi:3-carboxy-cis,cis-muconate cycloisomerase
LQLRDTVELLQNSLTAIDAALRSLADKHKSTPMAARSNLQQAVPISFGFKIARLLATFLRHQTRLNELKSRLFVIEFSGAAGTLATLPPSDQYPNLGLDCQKAIADELGLDVPEITWHTERDRISEFGSFCAVRLLT